MGAPLAYDPKTLPLGTVGKPHGTRGQLHFRLFNDGSRVLSSLRMPLSVWLEGPEGSQGCVIEQARFAHDHYLLGIAGVTDRDQATALVGRVLRVARDTLPPLAAGEFYWQDLVGCEVTDQVGRLLGRVQAIFDNGAHGVGSVVDAQGHETLIPLVAPLLLVVDVEGRHVQVKSLDIEDLDDAHLQGAEPGP